MVMQLSPNPPSQYRIKRLPILEVRTVYSIVMFNGKNTLETYREIPQNYLYNMDEGATKKYAHRRMVILMANDMVRTFQITPGEAFTSH